MPLYDFECQDCGRRFEDLVFEDDEENPVCPKCGSTNTLRLISEPSPMLKNAPPFKVGPVNQVFLNRIKQAEAGIAPPCGVAREHVSSLLGPHAFCSRLRRQLRFLPPGIRPGSAGQHTIQVTRHPETATAPLRIFFGAQDPACRFSTAISGGTPTRRGKPNHCDAPLPTQRREEFLSKRPCR